MVVLPRRSRSIFGVNSNNSDLGGVSDTQHWDLHHSHLATFLWLIHTEFGLSKPNNRL